MKSKWLVYTGALLPLLTWGASAHGVQPEKRRPWLIDERNARVLELPEEERAWPRYEMALKSIRPMPDALSDGGWKSRGPAWPEIRRYVIESRGAVDRALDASQRAFLGYLVSSVDDPENPFTSLAFFAETPYLGSMRSLTKLMIASYQLAEEDGDFDRAAEIVVAVFRMARHTAEEPSLIGALTGIGIEITAVDAFAATLARMPEAFSSDQLMRISDELERNKERQWLKRALHIEREMFMENVHLLFGPGPEDGPDPTRIGPWIDVSEFGADGAPDAEHRARLVLQMHAPRKETLERFDACLQEAHRSIDGSPWHAATWLTPELDRLEEEEARFLIPSIWTVNYHRFAASAIAAEAQTDALRIAIEAELLRRDRGVYPATSEEFTEDTRFHWPADPYSGLPLRYRVEPIGIKIYSVGIDREDDEGTPDGGLGFGMRCISPQSWETYRKSNPDALEELDGDWILYPPVKRN